MELTDVVLQLRRQHDSSWLYRSGMRMGWSCQQALGPGAAFAVHGGEVDLGGSSSVLLARWRVSDCSPWWQALWHPSPC